MIFDSLATRLVDILAVWVTIQLLCSLRCIAKHSISTTHTIHDSTTVKLTRGICCLCCLAVVRDIAVNWRDIFCPLPVENDKSMYFNDYFWTRCLTSIPPCQSPKTSRRPSWMAVPSPRRTLVQVWVRLAELRAIIPRETPLLADPSMAAIGMCREKYSRIKREI